MGDMSKEPSMEEILSSIKRIIAQDAELIGTRARGRTASPRSASAAVDRLHGGGGTVDEAVLELTDAARIDRIPHDPMPHDDVAPDQATAEGDDAAEQAGAVGQPLVSELTAQASRKALEALARPSASGEAVAPIGSRTIEDMVAEMLRPMLKEWLNANLPSLVETIVAREVARIAGGPS